MSVVLRPYRPEAALDTSFRAITAYHIGTDTVIVRLDWLKNGMQSGAAFHVRLGDEAKAGDTELLMPRNHDGFSIVANHEDVIASLRNLADTLEQQIPDQSDQSVSLSFSQLSPAVKP